MKKRVLTLLTAAAMLLSLAACGSSGSQSGNSGSGSGSSGGGGGGDGSRTIRVAIWDNNQLAGLQSIADEWGEANGYDVEFTVPGWDGYWTMLEAGVQGGEMPDVFWMHSQNADKYMASGVLLDLNSYIENDEAIDLDNYFEGITNLYTMDGTCYAIPKDHDTIAMVYNKAIFDKYGMDYPSNDWTWADYAAAAREITEKGKDDGIYGTYMNMSSNQDGWYNLVYSYGGEIISEDKKSSGFDKQGTIDAMHFLMDEILPACPTPDSMATTGADTMFLSGLVGMIFQGSWNAVNYANADSASDYAWAMMPYVDVNGNGQCEKEERCSIYNGLGWSINANTKDPDAAWSLVSHLSSKEGQIKQSELGVTMAAYIGCSEPFAETYGDMDISPFIDIEEQGTLVFRPYSKSAAIWESDVSDALVTAWNDPSQLDAVLAQITEEMNQTLAEENG